MYSEELLESLITQAYEAAVDANGWLTFLASLATALNSGSPSLYFVDGTTTESDIAICMDMDERMMCAYKEYYNKRNVWIQGARAMLWPGSVRSSHLMCARSVFLRSEWYADFCKPMNWTQGLGATIFQDGAMTANIGVFADDRRRAYDNEDLAFFGALTPHLRRAFRMHRQLAASEARGAALDGVLGALKTPVFLVSEAGGVVFMNAAASNLLQDSDALRIEQGVLRTLRPEDTTSLARLLAAAARRSTREVRDFGDTLKVTRSSGREPLELLICSLVTPESRILRQASLAAVFVNDTHWRAMADDSALIRLHGLTRTEAKVATALVRGASGKEVCLALGMSYNTLKTHVKRVYAKTGTRRRTELVHFLAYRVPDQPPA